LDMFAVPELVMLDGSVVRLRSQINPERLRNYALINDSDILRISRTDQIVLQRGGPVQTLDGVVSWSLDNSLGIVGKVSDFLVREPGYDASVPRLSLSAPANSVSGTEKTTLRVTQADGVVKLIELVVVNGPNVNAPAVVVPQVVSTIVNNGDTQRSSLTSLTIQFNTKVNVTSQSFEIKNRTTGATVPIIVEQIENFNGSTIRLTFQDGNQVIHRAIGNSLRDGWFTLRVQGAFVRSQVTSSTMAADYLFGQTNADRFYRLYGDLNGDQSVDNNDLRAMTRALGSSSHQSRYIEGFDLDGNGSITLNDYLKFLRNYRRRI
jgi:hypothetical protein